MKRGAVAELKKKQEESGVAMVKRKVSKGKLKVTGCMGLKWSATYPRQLCTETVRHFEDCVRNGSNDSRLIIYNSTCKFAMNKSECPSSQLQIPHEADAGGRPEVFTPGDDVPWLGIMISSYNPGLRVWGLRFHRGC